MPSLTRAEVAHLARLARIDLSDGELDHYAGQLDVILGAVAQVTEVAADDIPPTSHAVPLTNVVRAGRAAPVARRRSRRSRRPRGRGAAASACPRILDEECVMTDLTRLDRRRGRRRRRLGRGQRRRVDPGAPRPHRRRRRRPSTPSCTSTTDGALAAAAAVDAKRAAGEELGPLAGVPLALKDVLAMRGRPHDLRLEDPRGLAAAVRRDRRRAGCAEADVVILGKTNMDEFAMGSSTENSAYGATANPWDLEPHPGRLRRRLVRRGRRVRGAALDRHRHRRLDPPAGVGHRHRRREADLRRRLALRARGARLVARPGRAVRPHRARRGAAARRSIAGHDPLDSTSVDVAAARRRRRRARADVQGLRIGVVKQFGGEGYQAGVDAALPRGGRPARGARRRGRRGRLPVASTTPWPPTT